jgi:hypothetical protein
MEDKYSIKISPSNIIGDLIIVTYTADSFVITAITGICCFITQIYGDNLKQKNLFFTYGKTKIYPNLNKLLVYGVDQHMDFLGYFYFETDYDFSLPRH